MDTKTVPRNWPPCWPLRHVPADYPVRSGNTVRTVADLVEYEKLTCRKGLDMSMKLVALANYLQQPSWKNSLGEEWTLQRVVADELDRPTGVRPHAATDRLLGLCAALECPEARQGID